MSNKTNKLNYSFALSINEPIGTNMDNVGHSVLHIYARQKAGVKLENVLLYGS